MLTSTMIVASLLFFVALSECKLLILEDETKGAGGRYIFRQNKVYMSYGPVSARIKCKLPAWYNETLYGKPTIKWSVDGQNSDVLQLQNVENGKQYTCTVRNQDGKQIQDWQDTVLRVYKQGPSTTIDYDGPSPLNYSNSDTEPLRFVCKTGDSADKVRWFLDGQNITETSHRGTKIHDINQTLFINHPNYDDVGIYMCQSEKEYKNVAFRSVEGAPWFVTHQGKHSDSDNKLEGDPVSIIRELFGNPLKDLQWKRQKDDDSPIEEIDEKFLQQNPDVAERLKFYPTMNVTNGELELSKLTKEDRAHYWCQADNEHGTSSFKTLVRVKGKLDALWPFLGIVAEVIILVAIILLYERRRMKKDREQEESTDQKKPLTSANNDNNMRQRKA